MALANINAVVAQHVVGGGSVKIKIRHGTLQQQINARKLHFAIALFDGDTFCLGAVDLRRQPAVGDEWVASRPPV